MILKGGKLVRSIECGDFLHIYSARKRVQLAQKTKALRCIRKNRQAVGGFSVSD